MQRVTDQELEGLLARLKKNGMDPFYHATRGQAVQEILRQIPSEAAVGVGGSVTVRELGLPDALLRRGQKVFDHWQETDREARHAVGRLQQRSDLFLTSTNAVTLTGALVNVDASGNRVSAMVFGPSEVIVVAGINKIVPDIEAGLKRLRAVAAPQNCRRRGDPTPCARDLVCRDCDAPGRLCRVTTVIERRPFGIKRLSVHLVAETLGY